jgi:uncharacterized protein (TIGR03086 family)
MSGNLEHRVDLLESVLRKTSAVITAITPDDLARPTPCDDYDVRRLRDHVVGWARWFASLADDQTPSDEDGPPYRAGDRDAAAHYRAAADKLITAIRNRGGRDITLPERPEPVWVLVHEMLAETLIHGWDLATAIGQPTLYADDEVQAAHLGLSMMLRESYADEGFPAADTVAPASGDLHVLLRRSGRRPD